MLAVAPCGLAAGGTIEGRLLSMSLEDLGRIDVSAASLLPSTLLTTASSVTSLTPADWVPRGARRLNDALEMVPGVLVMPHSNGNQVLAIRGYARLTSFTGVAVTLDGVPLTDLYRSSPQYNLPGLNLGVMGQAQLIQGPGSALYGSDAFHGVLALRTLGTADGEENVASAAVGGRGFYEADVHSGGSLGSGGRWNLALAANGQGKQGLVAARPGPSGAAPVSVERDNCFDAQTAVLKASSPSVAGWQFDGGLYLHRYEADDFQGLGSRLAGVEDVGGLDTKLAMLRAGARKDFGDQRSLELKAYGWWVENNVPGRVLRAGVPLQRDLESRQDRAGLQAVYRASAPALRTDWAVEVGADRLHLREVRQTLHGLAGNLVNSSLNAASGAQRRIHYGTVELNTRLGESWSAVYGARLDDYSDFGSHRSPRAGLVFQPGAASAVKLLYGQAFRAPSAAERIGNVGTVLGNDSLRPEVITTLELLALRQTGRLLWQASVFRSIWRDGIAIVFRPELGINQYQNVERNRAHGASGSLTLQQGPWQLALGGAWITSRNAGSGARYSTFPRTMLNAVLARSVLEGAGRIELAQRWMADFDDIPRGDVFTPVALPHYSRTDLSYTHALSPRLALAVVARNLLDRDNRLPSALGSVGGIPEERRSLALRASWHY
jgi:iron complex outermembrane receptor protein